MRKNTKKRQNLKGFTLVEIIVVLVILGILASVTIAALTGYIDKSKDRVAVLEAKRWYIAAQAAVSEVYADGNLEMQKKPDKVLESGLILEGAKIGIINGDTLAIIQSGARNGSVSSSLTGNAKIAALTLQYMESLSNKKSEVDYYFPQTSGVSNYEIADGQTSEQFFNAYKGNTYVSINYNSDGTMSCVEYSKRGYSGIVIITRLNNEMNYVIKDTPDSTETRQ